MTSNSRFKDVFDTLSNSFSISSEDINEVLKEQLPQMPQHVEEWILNSAKDIATMVALTKDYHFPVHDNFHPLIKDFLKLPEIESLLVDAHPM